MSMTNAMPAGLTTLPGLEALDLLHEWSLSRLRTLLQGRLGYGLAGA